MYYLKKLGHQELGSIGADGKPQRGRYIYISSDRNVLSLFPPLTTSALNDNALLAIIPLYDGNKVYCNYVYHNDKFFTGEKNGRNEYRLYLNKELEHNSLLFQVGDIILFKKEDMIFDNEHQNVYFMARITPQDVALYTQCSAIINSSGIRGDHAIATILLPQIEEQISAIKQNNNIEVSIGQDVTNAIIKQNETREDSTSAIASLFNATSFRDFVMTGYGNRCAITGNVIKWNNYNNLEAAHIYPRSHGGEFLPSNGIAMCRDLHWAFDKGFFTINDDFTVKVHDDIDSDFLREFDGQQIRLPEDPFFIPNKDNLKYHRDNVFGLFRTTGRL